jgi:hypothetical protein
VKTGIDHLSERAFYRIQKLLVASLFQLAEADGCDYSSNLSQGDVLSFNGTQDHPRNTSKSISILINLRLKK